ncbi:fumarylacetoacetate hydrolase family protein [Nonomuraea dietziae]|uniref:fumarylacetoacetate hydrolase family protein n=1 Tax=Nonomuraea dietziae TaxID=65515 RepID=UPI0033E9229F
MTKDTATTLGPWLVTADELEPYRDHEGFLRLALAVTVNGVEIGRDLLSNMSRPFEDLVAYASRGTWIRPGDVPGAGSAPALRRGLPARRGPGGGARQSGREQATPPPAWLIRSW